MAEATRPRAKPLQPCLPDEIVIWEILVRLPPKSLLRCRAVCRVWRRDTSSRDFLLAHHGRQPYLPVVCAYRRKRKGGRTEKILAFDHRSADAQLQPVARLEIDSDKLVFMEASCDGLLILSIHSSTGSLLSVYNPTTRQHALLRHPSGFRGFNFLGMYLHRPSGEYRLLLYGTGGHPLPGDEAGCYVFTVGSNLPARYIGCPEAASVLRFKIPALVRDSLHWCTALLQSESSLLVIAFDTVAESFRQIRAPDAPTWSKIFETDGTLGIYSYNDDAMEVVVDMWVLQNYQGEVWEHRYSVRLPFAEIRGQAGKREGCWGVTVVSADGDILLLLFHDQWLFYIDIDGQLVDSFHRDGQLLYARGLRLKQTLVPHNFFHST